VPERVKGGAEFYGFKGESTGHASQWYGNIVGGRICLMVGWELWRSAPDFLSDADSTVLEMRGPGMKSQGIFAAEKVNAWVKGARPGGLEGRGVDHTVFSSERSVSFSVGNRKQPEHDHRYFWHNQPTRRRGHPVSVPLHRQRLHSAAAEHYFKVG